MNKLFGTDGIRGIAGEGLTVGLALRVGLALGTVISEREDRSEKVIIGQDTRESSDALVYALASGLAARGVGAVLAGVIPTPAVSYLTESEGADGGIMVSASHNPYEYNGIKIFVF